MPHFPDLIRQLPAFEGAFDAFELAAKGCRVLFASYPAGTSIEPHSHDSENVGVITRGELVLRSQDEELRYGPGDWYHVAPQQVHSAYFPIATCEIEFWFSRESVEAKKG